MFEFSRAQGVKETHDVVVLALFIGISMTFFIELYTTIGNVMDSTTICVLAY